MKKKRIIIIALLLVLSVSAGAAGYFGMTVLNRRSATAPAVRLDTNGSAISGVYQGKSKEQVLSDLQKAEVTVTDKVSSSAVFDSGAKGSYGTWVVENLQENNVIMQCEIYDGDKLLAKSVPIYPNQHIERIELLESVEAGSHDVTAYISYFTLDTKKYISKAGYKINLTVNK
ncbi:MAG: hypothetical protein ABF449_02590 [Ethanoligenens sp.]